MLDRDRQRARQREWGSAFEGPSEGISPNDLSLLVSLRGVSSQLPFTPCLPSGEVQGRLLTHGFVEGSVVSPILNTFKSLMASQPCVCMGLWQMIVSLHPFQTSDRSVRIRCWGLPAGAHGGGRAHSSADCGVGGHIQSWPSLQCLDRQRPVGTHQAQRLTARLRSLAKAGGVAGAAAG